MILMNNVENKCVACRMVESNNVANNKIKNQNVESSKVENRISNIEEELEKWNVYIV